MGFVSLHPDLYVLNLGLGQQQFLVVVALPLLSLGLQLQHSFLGLGQTLPEVCDLRKSLDYMRLKNTRHTTRVQKLHMQHKNLKKKSIQWKKKTKQTKKKVKR